MNKMNVSSPLADSHSGKYILSVEWEVSPALDVEIQKSPLLLASRRPVTGLARRTRSAYQSKNMQRRFREAEAREILPTHSIFNRN